MTKELNLNFAVRGDHFSDFGSTFNPKASFRYQPIKQLMVRGTVSTGFRAPTLPELYGTPRTLTPSSVELGRSAAVPERHAERGRHRHA